MTDLPTPVLNAAKKWLTQPLRHFVNGQWITGGTLIHDVINPAREETLARMPIADAGVVDQAVEAARNCFQTKSFRGLPNRRRFEILRDLGEVARRHRVELATLEALNNGKLYREAYADDLPDCADIFDYYAGWIDKIYGETCPVGDHFLNYTRREPVGVCAQIVPWNFPLLMAMWKIAPALATGNSVVIKPSEHTPLSLLRWLELARESVDLPPGLINLVLGDGTTGDLLTRHPGVHKVAFTGSTPVGKAIVRASGETNLKKISLELGGKSPNIFFADTPDLEAAMDRSFQSIFSHKGEKCSEPTRFIVERRIYQRVVDGLVARTKSYRVGDNFDPRNHQGAQNNAAHFEKIMRYIEIGKAEGADLLAGGRRVGQVGFFVEPTIFANVRSPMRIWTDEIFGPVLSIAPFDSDDEAVRLANETSYGLAAGLWTADVRRAHRVAQELDAGMVFINRYGCYDFCSPFGGFKESGWAKEMGIHSLDPYLKTKSIWVAL
jgi:aldehyde dehydrogenase (NAD+)